MTDISIVPDIPQPGGLDASTSSTKGQSGACIHGEGPHCHQAGGPRIFGDWLPTLVPQNPTPPFSTHDTPHVQSAMSHVDSAFWSLSNLSTYRPQVKPHTFLTNVCSRLLDFFASCHPSIYSPTTRGSRPVPLGINLCSGFLVPLA